MYGKGEDARHSFGSSSMRHSVRSVTSIQTPSRTRLSARSPSASWTESPQPETPSTRLRPTRAQIFVAVLAELYVIRRQNATVPVSRIEYAAHGQSSLPALAKACTSSSVASRTGLQLFSPTGRMNSQT